MKLHSSLSLFLLSAIILTQTSAIQLTYSPGENVCLLPFQNRGPAQNLSLVNYCDDPSFSVIDDYCYAPCKPGFEYFMRDDPRETACIEKCPEMPIYSRGYWWCTNTNWTPKNNTIWDYKYLENCENNHGSGGCTQSGSNKYIPWCKSPNSWITIQCKVNVTYAREKVPAKSRLGCQKGFEEIDGLCYPNCQNGYQTFGKTCLLRQCSAGYTQCGQFCTKEASCENQQVKNFGEFFGEIQRLSDKNLVKIDLSSLVCTSIQAMKATTWI